jgi:small subunit ribosomal protein S16
MLKIRLQRVGRKHEPTFRVVLTDSKNSTKSGKFLEVLGSYDPRKTTEKFEGDKIKEWMGKGAQLSDTMKNLLITHKIIEGKKVNVLPRKSPPKKEEPVAEEKAPEVRAEATSTETPASEVVAEEVPVATAAEEEVVSEVATEETPAEGPTDEAIPVEETAPEEKPAE